MAEYDIAALADAFSDTSERFIIDLAAIDQVYLTIVKIWRPDEWHTSANELVFQRPVFAVISIFDKDDSFLGKLRY
jgi:hypothetical protein